MTTLAAAVDAVLAAQKKSRKPLAIVLAGHNGSGKSTMWYRHLADLLQIPLINADRLIASQVPESTSFAPTFTNNSTPVPLLAPLLADQQRYAFGSSYPLAGRSTTLLRLVRVNGNGGEQSAGK